MWSIANKRKHDCFIAILSKWERIYLFKKVILVSLPCLKQIHENNWETVLSKLLRKHSFILSEDKS